jgi:hypothetical protein
MDAHDWVTVIVTVIVTLIIGAPITYLLGIAASLHAPRLAQFLDRRKLLKETKTKKQALVEFNRIKAFYDGTRDRYSFYILIASWSILCAIAASTLFVIFSIQSGNVYPISPEYGAVVLVATLAVCLAVILLAVIYDTARKIEQFDAYKIEFEKRWGSTDSSE